MDPAAAMMSMAPSLSCTALLASCVTVSVMFMMKDTLCKMATYPPCAPSRPIYMNKPNYLVQARNASPTDTTNLA